MSTCITNSHDNGKNSNAVTCIQNLGNQTAPIPQIEFLFFVKVQLSSSSAGKSERDQVGGLEPVERLHVERFERVIQIGSRKSIPPTMIHELDGLLQHLLEKLIGVLHIY